MNELFPKPISLGANVKIKLDLSNYATKGDFQNVTVVDTSDFTGKSGFSNLKSDVDKSNIDKLKNVPSNLSKLSNVVM